MGNAFRITVHLYTISVSDGCMMGVIVRRNTLQTMEVCSTATIGLGKSHTRVDYVGIVIKPTTYRLV